MTAKEKLRQAVDELTELEAKEALAFITGRRELEPVIALFENAPLDDEPVTEQEERALEEARAAHRRGETLPLDQIRDEFA